MLKRKQHPDFPDTTGWNMDKFIGAIIKTLEQICYHTGQRPVIVLNNWLEVVKIVLEQLPEQFKAMIVTGRLAPVLPEATEVFQKAEQCHYQMNAGGFDHSQIWSNYAKAFYLLLEATAPGLGSDFYSDTTYGPDILGHIYESWANPSSQSLQQHFTPYDVCELLARTAIRGNGKRKVLAQLAKALRHPDRRTNAAVLLDGMLVPKDDSAVYSDWFFNKMIPDVIAGGQFEPVKVYDPTVGSARSLLAIARQFPPWANRLGLVQYFGQDFDPTCATLSKVSLMLYGLNGYACHLTHSFAILQRYASNKSILKQHFSQPYPSLGEKIPLKSLILEKSPHNEGNLAQKWLPRQFEF